MYYTKDQRLFIVKTHEKSKSYAETQQKFANEYGITTLNRNTIYQLMKKLNNTGSVCNVN